MLTFLAGKSADNTKFMPQLDLLTFFTQFFWAILCLFLFYFFVSKLILPELTRVLKYRSKASALSSTSDRLDASSHTGQEGSEHTFSHSSGKSGSSTLYQYAISSSARVLTEARQKRDNFLDSVTSSKTIGERSVSTNSTDSYPSLSPSDEGVIKSGKQNKPSLNEEGSRSHSKSSKSSKSSIPLEATKRSESAKGSKGAKNSKNPSRDPKNSKGGDSSKS